MRILAAAVCLLLFSGCAKLEGMATRYRAERMVWQAQREETRLKVGKTAPDSATLLRIRAAYTGLRATFHPPFVQGSGKDVERLRVDIARQVGGAELTAARASLAANRPDLGLESARWVASIAEADTGLGRQAGFATAMALRQFRRYDEAVATLRGMLDRYPPIAPPSLDREDEILGIPDAIISLRSEMGDSVGARKEQGNAIAYYRRVLAGNPPPMLEAQVRARISRTLLEMGDANSAYAEVSTLRKLVSTTPALKSLEAELLYTEARIRGMQHDYAGAIQRYDSVVKTYPDSPYAARALLDAAVISERVNDNAGAIARYRAILDRPNADPGVGAVASYRMAMVKEQMGNWAEAKQLLEQIPLQFPRSRAAIEAPVAIVEHYLRLREPDAAKAALVKSIETYRKLIAKDTSSVYGAVYRWNILRAYTALRQWRDALATVNQMAEKDRGAPIVAEALFEGAQIAQMLKDNALSERYLQQILVDYPESPRAAAVRKFLGSTARKGGSGQK